MNLNVAATEPTAGVAERRKFARHRLSAPVTVRLSDGSESIGMTVEISEGGMSALFGAPLKVGDKVTLEPVGGGAAAATVRRQMGKFYGFEFLQLGPQQSSKIRETCKMLPPYYSRTLDLWKR
ncbi:MAG: PilZ domain-containing protein [Candidatus Sulfotelmatobacter sp.]